MNRRIRLRWDMGKRICLWVVFMSLLAGCSLPWYGQNKAVKACTLIGCESGLSISLEGVKPEQYNFQVNTPDQKTYTGNCPSEVFSGTYRCEANGFWIGGLQENGLTVTVAWSSNKVTQVLHPTYQTFRPNGPDCEPECKNGAASIQLP